MKKLLTIHLSPADGSLTDIYKSQIGGYPKFYKMDPLARLGFVASELLLDKEHELTGKERLTESLIPTAAVPRSLPTASMKRR